MAFDTVMDAPRNGNLVGHAVHRNRMLSFEGVLERIFSLAFRGLVYPQIWEDPVVDMAAMEIKPHHHVVTIASGGCNVLSYLTASPARITAVASSSTSPAIAPRRSRHQPVGRLPITFIASTTSRAAVVGDAGYSSRSTRSDQLLGADQAHHRVVHRAAERPHSLARVVVGQDVRGPAAPVRARPSRARADPAGCCARSRRGDRAP